jgi:hypothetical protein
LIAVYFLVGIEWVFYATKPSFVEQLPLGGQLLLLAIAPLPLAATALVAVTAAGLLGLLVPRVATLLVALVPATFAAAGLVLMIDNFTYTVFDFGVVVVRSAWRLLYGLFFIALFVVVVRGRHRSLEAGGVGSVLPSSIAGALLISMACALLALSLRPSPAAVDASMGSPSGRRPDVLLLSGDGLEVERLARYGNPVTEMSDFAELGPTAVAFDNAFSNANNTSASTALVLTGRSGLATRHLHTHQFFREADAYRHRPDRPAHPRPASRALALQ